MNKKKRKLTMPKVHFAFWGKTDTGPRLNRLYDKFRTKYNLTDLCYLHVMKARGWSNEVICPHCGDTHPAVAVASEPQRNWRCGGKNKCHLPFIVFTKTRLGSSHIEPKKLLALCYLVANHPKPSRERAKKIAGMGSNKNVDKILKVLKFSINIEIKEKAKSAKAPQKAAELLLQEVLRLEAFNS